MHLSICSARERMISWFVNSPGVPLWLQRQELLQQAAVESKAVADDAPPHYFTLFQQLTLPGFSTSEPGHTQVLRFEMAPGRYEGCIDYQTGETAWANN